MNIEVEASDHNPIVPLNVSGADFNKPLVFFEQYSDASSVRFRSTMATLANE